MHGAEQVHSGLYFGDGNSEITAICIYFLCMSMLRKSFRTSTPALLTSQGQ